MYYPTGNIGLGLASKENPSARVQQYVAAHPELYGSSGLGTAGKIALVGGVALVGVILVRRLRRGRR